MFVLWWLLLFTEQLSKAVVGLAVVELELDEEEIMAAVRAAAAADCDSGVCVSSNICCEELLLVVFVLFGIEERMRVV